MYIFKNALKCISRAKGRNILMAIIALVIAVSACIGLSIRQASEDAKAEVLEGMTVTATISYDRQSAMSGMQKPSGGGGGSGGMPEFDRDSFSEMFGSSNQSLTLDEYKKYAEAESVSDFYYSATVYFNGSDNLDPVSTETEDDSDESESEDTEESGSDAFGGMPGGMGQFPGFSGGMGMVSTGDFTVIGYSGESAMTEFKNGTASITDGEIFAEGSDALECIVSEELAIYNSLSVGDTITLTNPSDEEELYDLTVVGIYTSSEANDLSISMFGVGQDPANKIYMSYEAIGRIISDSKANSETVTDETSGLEYETALTESISATYCFASPEDYEKFDSEARALGLSDSYTISSSDINAYENSLAPLTTLSEMAGWFLIVILVIGAIVLVVLNIFNIRERKYEIGVLTAMGMKKHKVALQFMSEILVVTMIAVLIGAGIGAVSSVPITNALLENQIESQQTQKNEIEANFGRGQGQNGSLEMNLGGNMPEMNERPNDIGGQFEGFMGNATEYITEVDSAMNLKVVFSLLGIGLLLALIASSVSVLFVMRYDPLKILANRD